MKTKSERQTLEREFREFHARFGDIFTRSEPREQSFHYLRGLLTESERKTSWQLAEMTGQSIPDSTQRLLYKGVWNEDEARDRLMDFVSENLGDREGVLIFDETGFIKQGKRSAGVQRQYSGTAGKVENCQIGVFLGYWARKGHAFLDRRLYIPQSWDEDRERCAAAKIPEQIRFQTKPELAVAMLENALARKVPFRWVCGDEVYGSSYAMRDAVENAGKHYVFTVASNLRVFTRAPVLQAMRKPETGRPRTRARLSSRSSRPRSVKSIVAEWPPDNWRRISIADGEKGPREYDWAGMRIIESKDGLPHRGGWLLARRSVSRPEDIAYYLSNAPLDATLAQLAGIAGKRFVIEQCFKEAKGRVGLDRYEVRYWHSWHRHITLSMMAYAFLVVLRSRRSYKKTPAISIG